MNYSNPILVCDENEEFRILVRDMLTKNGFFHVLEAANTDEALEYLKDKKDYFILIESQAVADVMISHLKNKKNYIVFSHHEDAATHSLIARLGVEHFMSYPFHSKKLLEKIGSLI